MAKFDYIKWVTNNKHSKSLLNEQAQPTTASCYVCDVTASLNGQNGQILAYALIDWYYANQATYGICTIDYSQAGPNYTNMGMLDPDAVYGGNGSNSAPSYSFAADTDVGMYSSGTGAIRFASNGYHAASIGASNADDGTIYAEYAYSFLGDTNTSIYNGAADQISFATGGALRGRFYDGGLVLDQLGSTSGTDLVVDGSNVVHSKSSSKKYKRNIVDIALDSNKVYNLRPVDFEWNEKSATEGKKDIGLIAEEVAEILPEIVNYKDNKPESVSYDKLSVILLMEIKKLKEEIEKLKENN